MAELFTDRWTLEQAEEAYGHFDGQAKGKRPAKHGHAATHVVFIASSP